MPSFGLPGEVPAASQPLFFLRLAVVLAGLFVLPWPSFAAVPPKAVSAQCDEAAAVAARQSSVPLDVLLAVTRTETGRPSDGSLLPWPWTVNMEGAGRWFASEDEARAYVFKHFKRGARSFDVGCFQINYKWHGQAFGSIDEMFDPVKNALYAARFLSDLYAELGDWTKAAGAYHSRTKEYADRYEARFARIREDVAPLRVAAAEGPRATFGAPQRIDLDRSLTGGPLFGGGSAAMGSLVPVAGGGTGGSAFLNLSGN